MTQLNYLKLAKQGDTQAIAVLINRSLQPKGINAKIAFKNSCLKVMLESTTVPEQQVLVEFIRRGITGLNISSVKIVQVYGRQTGEEFPAWSQEFTLAEELPPSSNSSEIKLTNSPTKKQSTDKSSEYYQSISGKKQYDPKVVIFVILSALWNFCKWYISGFSGKSYEETYVSSKFIRSCHQGLRMFVSIIFIILGVIILALRGYHISSPPVSSVSSSSGSVSESSSISGKVNGRLCAKNFNESMAGGAEATFDSSNKTMNIIISDSGKILTEQGFKQISTNMANSTFSTCDVKTVKVESSGYSGVIQNP
ncbi:hypothetical protein [Nostoc sp. WHI]|uniref:hypothetical protein n=1 Tax=Nostoc sp. WHI TaxID=2650611 RepID=UPI0018C5BA18|nr:hypothetical protein [Nostoc sp. WHI]MBG1265205.1 hypothetical protein [Nostoc sp. WHI]MBG1270691.1 hypothetical protein [Nostoc sp. WHI]